MAGPQGRQELGPPYDKEAKPTMLGGRSETESWTKNLKAAAKKKFLAVVEHAQGTLMNNVKPTVLRTQIDQIEMVCADPNMNANL